MRAELDQAVPGGDKKVAEVLLRHANKLSEEDFWVYAGNIQDEVIGHSIKEAYLEPHPSSREFLDFMLKESWDFNSYMRQRWGHLGSDD